MSRYFLAVISVFLFGCTTPVPVLKPVELIACKVDSSLEAPCDPPVLLVEGETFDQVLGKDVVVRMGLRECRARQAALAEALKSCNEVILKYNKSLQK
jgi:hypothetical protein